MIKNKWIYVIAIFVHIFCVISYAGSSKIDYGTPFWGATYFGDMKYYANSILLFSIYLLYSFNDTKKYISGYGILEMIRSLKRDIVVRNILIKQIKNLILLTGILYLCFIVECVAIERKIYGIKFEDIIMDILLHLFVMYSLLLWQSILEIFLDERIAIGVVIGLSIIQIILGNIVYTYEMSEGFNLILYVNLYASLRTDFMRMPMSVMLGAVIIIILLQVLILRRLVIKKDIMQLSSL